MYELERTQSTGRISSWGVRKAGGSGREIETNTIDGDGHELHANTRFGGVNDMQCNDLKVGGGYCRGSGGFFLSRFVQVSERLNVLNCSFRDEVIERDDVFGGKGVQAIAFVIGDDGDDAV